MISAGLGPENNCAGEASSNCKGQTHPLVSEDVSKDYHRKSSVVKITGRESQGACRKEELIGGKKPVVK
jgi:hypothetical protein